MQRSVKAVATIVLNAPAFRELNAKVRQGLYALALAEFSAPQLLPEVVTEGAKGTEMAATYARLEKLRGVKVVRADTGTAQTVDYNAARIARAVRENALGPALSGWFDRRWSAWDACWGLLRVFMGTI